MADGSAGLGSVSGIASALRLDSVSSGPFTGTVAELMARFGEPEATAEARVRVDTALEEMDLRTAPMLTDCSRES